MPLPAASCKVGLVTFCTCSIVSIQAMRTARACGRGYLHRCPVSARTRRRSNAAPQVTIPVQANLLACKTCQARLPTRCRFPHRSPSLLENTLEGAIHCHRPRRCGRSDTPDACAHRHPSALCAKSTLHPKRRLLRIPWQVTRTETVPHIAPPPHTSYVWERFVT
jgi:hypothetical protein